MHQIFISPLAIALSLSTGTGILLHETKVDKLASLTIMSSNQASSTSASPASLESMPHTHVESASFESASREFRSKNPNQTPRRNEDKKYRLPKQVARGHHLFDSYHLPLDQFV